MSINSMTGFGRGGVMRAGYAVTVEVSAVNRKQFDLRLNAPRALAVLEPQITKQVRSAVSRGGITVALHVERAAGGAVVPVLDMACAEAYVNASRAISDQFLLQDTLSTAALLRMPGVMQVAGGSDPDGETIWPGVRDALKEALTAFMVMRRAEGETLSRDMSKRLVAMRRLRAKVQKRAPLVVQHYRVTLQKRTASLVDVPSSAGLRDAIAREVALFADKCDISEELVRLESHFEQSLAQLESKGAVGRTLEFLCQEMLREINTIGSKANDRHIAGWVVELKSELEALREQVQNVE
ncbi:MAG: YicC/YloC family endoribonuclease [Kiritimatiellia bacterium]